jgi:hypothetical protein
MNWRIFTIGFLMFCMLFLGACVIGPDSSAVITLAPTAPVNLSNGYCGDHAVQYPENCSNCSVDAGICPVETPPASLSQQTQTEQQPVPSSAPSPNQ